MPQCTDPKAINRNISPPFTVHFWTEPHNFVYSVQCTVYLQYELVTSMVQSTRGDAVFCHTQSQPLS